MDHHLRVDNASTFQFPRLKACLRTSTCEMFPTITKQTKTLLKIRFCCQELTCGIVFMSHKYFVSLPVSSGVANNWTSNIFNILAFYTLHMTVRFDREMKNYLKAIWIMRKNTITISFKNMTDAPCLCHFHSMQQSLLYSFRCYNFIALLMGLRRQTKKWNAE